MEQHCTGCGLAVLEYYRGRRCKVCINAQEKAYYHERKKHDERFKEGRKQYARNNAEKVAAVGSAWAKANPERRRQSYSKYAKNHPAVNAAKCARRKAAKLKATPAWADQEKIRGIYAEAVRLSTETGVEHHVDHIVPLVSSLVCGLHCEANLRVLAALDNLSKGNHWWPDMPEN